jgi:hypothetical protein
VEGITARLCLTDLALILVAGLHLGWRHDPQA